MKTRPGFQIRGFRSSLRRSWGLERIPSAWKSGLFRIGGFSNDFSESISVLAQRICLLVMSVSMNKPIVWNYILSPRTGKKHFWSSALYFRGISSSLTWCHSARLIKWFTYELLMSLRSICPLSHNLKKILLLHMARTSVASREFVRLFLFEILYNIPSWCFCSV